MIDWFKSGGFFMWPILAAALVMCISGLRSFVRGSAGDRDTQRNRADTVLFWGAFAAVIGIFGTLGGIAQLARVVQRAGGVTSGLLWGGVGVSLVTSLFGLGVLLLALVLWYVLRTRASSI